MVGIDTAPETSEATNEIPTAIPQKKGLDVKEIGVVATAVEKSFESVPEFSERMQTELGVAQSIVDAVRSGAIDENEAVRIIAVGRTELAMATETDSLTELANRPTIEKTIREQVALAKRNGTQISVAFLDLDKFKEINDVYGHDAGDAVLQGLGGYLRYELKRPTDKAGRWGGEEFLVVLPDTDEEGALQLLNDLKQGMNESVSEAAFQTGQYQFDREITASIGLISTTINSKDERPIEDITSELINIADQRLLLAKKNGRNQVVGTKQERDLTQQV